MRHWDFIAAYLQAQLILDEVVYCSPPPGYSTALVKEQVLLVPAGQGDGIERLCVVETPICGMAQAGRH